ncbi:hypothetical protein [Xanthomonas cannabis]|uniref:hypothetical protein n=1 Tax=Xanthomonas cannabis TaxID=1885674 RepID=UPI001FB935D5|nr:hypothetical protein [Xanthomonas cannabis]NIK16796.1 hypothetical protein [Xanthomonas cannabis]
MSTAPSTPTSVPVDLLPASARCVLWDVGEVLRGIVARAAVEQANEHLAHPLSRQLGALLLTLRRRFARSAVELQQRVAASTTHHHPEAP